MRKIRKRTVHPHCDAAYRYAKDVLRGKIVVCELTKLACSRFMKDLDDKKWNFNRDRAERFCDFVELMPHVKGKWAGTPLKLEPWQSFIFVNLYGFEDKETGLRRFRRSFVFVPRKNGKGLALDTPIPTPDGWTTMGDLRVGDTLYAEDGSECTVTFVSDHRELDCYEIEFANGEKIVCDGDHLWETTAKVDSPGSTAVYPRVKVPLRRVRDTRKLFASQKYGVRNDNNHTIEMPNPLVGRDADLPVDPYLLGAWLGNGCAKAAVISYGHGDAEFAALQFRDLGFPVRIRVDRTCSSVILAGGSQDEPLISKLRKLGVYDNKRIPKEYLRASYAQRLALLQGLMDTDGYADSAGKAQEFSVVHNRSFAEDVCELLSSFGIKYGIKEKTGLRCNGRVVPGIAYRIQFFMYRDVLPVFRLPRKLNRQPVSCKEKVKPRSRSLSIVSIQKVDTVKTKCIQVDSANSLFLCGRTMIPTHNTSISAPLGLGMLTIEAEPGSEIYCGATRESQADEVFRPAKAMAERARGFKGVYGITVAASAIHREMGMSFFKRLIGKPGEGQSPYCAIHDEYHEHPTSEQVDSMDTGMGARQEPLQFIITTAGTDTSSPCKDMYDYACKVLDGSFENEQFFALIYGCDQGDDWTDFDVWKKANPNLGVSISEDYLRGKLQEAIQRTSLQNTVKTKHLNVWCNVGVGWMNMAKWAENANPLMRLEDFKGSKTWIGIDLASKVDLTAMMILIFHESRFYLFGKYYLPSETVKLKGNEHYQRWAADGILTSTPGARTDYGYLEDDLKAVYDLLEVQEVVYDPREAEYLMQNIREQVSCPVVEFIQSAAQLSEPMKEFEAQYLAGNLIHTGDPVLAWSASNVVLRENRNKLYYPCKERQENKIDPIVAAIMAMARAKAGIEDLATQGFVEL